MELECNELVELEKRVSETSPQTSEENKNADSKEAIISAASQSGKIEAGLLDH